MVNRILCVTVLVVATSVACTPATEADVENHQTSADHWSPSVPFNRYSNLQAYEVSFDGSVVEMFPEDEAEMKYDVEADSPSASFGEPEIEDILGSGFVVTGIGARVDNGAFTRMRLHARSILSSGEWGSGAGWRDWVRHSSDDLQSEPEAEIVSVSPRVLVGLGMSVNDQNVTMIQLVERDYSPSSGKLEGAYYTKQEGIGDPELYWDTRFIDASSSVLDKTVIVGVGLHESNDNVGTMRIWTAQLDTDTE